MSYSKKELKAFKEDLKSIEVEVVEDLEINKINSDNSNRYEVDTIYGKYRFYFDNDSIFGRFYDFDKELIIKHNKSEIVNGTLYHKKYTINPYTGKFNFHYNDIYDFTSELYRLVLKF